MHSAVIETGIIYTLELKIYAPVYGYVNHCFNFFPFQYAPNIYEPAKAHVHHLILSECPGYLKDQLEQLSEEELKGVDCTGSKNLYHPLSLCRLGAVIAGWAVGGGVSGD